MKTILLISIRYWFAFSIILGLAYPLAITLVANGVFPRQSGGSIIYADNKPVGSELLAQSFTKPEFFWPRASAKDFSTLPSAATNLSPASKEFAKYLEQAKTSLGTTIGQEMLTRSASGLDPDITPQSAYAQVFRIASARHLPPEQVRALVSSSIQNPTFRLLGETRLNVLRLNLKLEQLSK